MSEPIAFGARVGFDYGDKRIGVATSDKESILVSPHSTILNDEKIEIKLKEIIAECDPIYIVIGNPKHLSGALSVKSQSALKFAHQIKSFFVGPIYLVDERLSTVNSNNKLREVGISERDGKSIVDQIAAITILENALANEKSNRPIGDLI
jgi:putative Holliday junction resolvase